MEGDMMFDKAVVHALLEELADGELHEIGSLHALVRERFGAEVDHLAILEHMSDEGLVEYEWGPDPTDEKGSIKAHWRITDSGRKAPQASEED